ncbi:MAG: hypothetical protein H0W61_14790 [Bacteroidetes bacterium]|nr:hypothetical protein [Bacteroidota bacterium]
MKKQNTILLLIICLTSLSSFSQDSLRHDKKNYVDFLHYPDENSQNHFLMCNYQFFYSAIGKTIGARGTMASFGLNLARFFSTKIIIAAVADIKLLPGIWPIKPSSNFTSEFNNSFIKTYDNQVDSANANIVQSAFNQQGRPIIGQNVFTAGVALSLFPQKYGGVLLQVKYGGMGFQIHGVYGNKYVNNGANDKVGMGVTGNWIYEITFKPVAFFENTFINTTKNEEGKFGKSFVLSFYYERLNFKSAEFNGTKVTQMVSSDFINKYRIDNRFGFKIGFAMY